MSSKGLNRFFDLTVDRVNWKRYYTFKNVFYALLIIFSATILFDVDAFYGADSIVFKSNPPETNTTYFILNMLSFPNFQNWYLAFFIVQITALILSYFRKFETILSVVVWFTTVNLINASGPIYTGGEVLVKLLLFYMIFIKEDQSGKNNVLRNVLNNVFFVACLIQVILVYVFSAWYKWIDPNWVNGNAFGFVANIDAYSVPWVSNIISDYPLTGKWFTWIGLGYQTLFPVAIWFRKIKPYFLLIGVAFHLSISLFLGIFAFGLIMVSVYLLFIDLPKRIRNN